MTEEIQHVLRNKCLSIESILRRKCRYCNNSTCEAIRTELQEIMDLADKERDHETLRT